MELNLSFCYSDCLSVNGTSSYQVVNGEDVKISWIYQLSAGEKMLSILLQFSKKGAILPLAIKDIDKTIERFPMGKNNNVYTRYKEGALISIDDDVTKKVELTLREVQISEDDGVTYVVRYTYLRARDTGFSEDEMVQQSSVTVVGKNSCYKLLHKNNFGPFFDSLCLNFDIVGHLVSSGSRGSI